MTPYAEYLLARPKKPALTQAARKVTRSKPQPSSYERGLSKSVGAACNDFWKRRGISTEGGDWNWNDR
jgi:hypothetical protein